MTSLHTVPDTALSESQARQLTEQIRLLAGSVADGMDRLVERIRQAQEGRVHEVLGYRSWTEYVSVEFADVLPRLQREPRRDFVRELAASGMSTRAIAPVVGVHHDTVARDLKSAPVVGNTTPEPVTGLDGKTYSRPAPVEPIEQPVHDWSETVERLTQSGWVARRDAEKPYATALIVLSRAADDVSKVQIDPQTLASNVPETSKHRLPEIQEAAEWLASFAIALKEAQA